jgi:hypothetical protein
MLPGYVSGFYSYDNCHVDLTQLSRYARAALVQAEATGIDIQVCVDAAQQHSSSDINAQQHSTV